MTGFDPAAVFLLDMGFENLFERAGDGFIDHRCVGCGEIVRSWERLQHHAGHRRERTREERRRVKRVQQQRVASLAKARAARARPCRGASG